MTTATAATVWHLGALHPVEQAVTAVLAFGPFVVLGVVVTLRQRALAREEAAEPSVATVEGQQGTDLAG